MGRLIPANLAEKAEDDALSRTVLAYNRAKHRRKREQLFSKLESVVQGIAAVMSDNWFIHGTTPDDLRQEGVEAILRAMPRYRPEAGSFLVFAAIVADRRMKNLVRNANRHCRREPETDRDHAVSESTRPDDSETPEHAAQRREQLELLNELANKALRRDELRLLREHLRGRSDRAIARRRGNTDLGKVKADREGIIAKLRQAAGGEAV